MAQLLPFSHLPATSTDGGVFFIEGRELDTILAALRLWQDCGAQHLGLVEIAENCRGERLSNEEINTLCEELNQ